MFPKWSQASLMAIDFAFGKAIVIAPLFMFCNSAGLEPLFVCSCETKPTLQKYYVKNTESADFVSIDLAPSIINTGKIKLTSEEKAALQSFNKMNILAFKYDSTQLEKYNKENPGVYIKIL